MMTKYLAAVVFMAFAIPAFAQDKKEEQAPPPPTKADIEKLVKQISADKEQINAYCQMVKLYNEAYDAGEKQDEKKAEELAQKADEMGEKLGEEYARIIDGLAEVDPESEEGKALYAAFEPLDKECPQG